MIFKIPVHITDDTVSDNNTINESQIDLSEISQGSSVSNHSSSVSKIHILYVVRKTAQILAAQRGFLL